MASANVQGHVYSTGFVLSWKYKAGFARLIVFTGASRVFVLMESSSLWNYLFVRNGYSLGVIKEVCIGKWSPGCW